MSNPIPLNGAPPLSLNGTTLTPVPAPSAVPGEPAPTPAPELSTASPEPPSEGQGMANGATQLLPWAAPTGTPKGGA
jgi:hypothetical protein